MANAFDTIRDAGGLDIGQGIRVSSSGYLDFAGFTGTDPLYQGHANIYLMGAEEGRVFADLLLKADASTRLDLTRAYLKGGDVTIKEVWGEAFNAAAPIQQTTGLPAPIDKVALEGEVGGALATLWNQQQTDPMAAVMRQQSARRDATAAITTPGFGGGPAVPISSSQARQQALPFGGGLGLGVALLAAVFALGGGS